MKMLEFWINLSKRGNVGQLKMGQYWFIVFCFSSSVDFYPAGGTPSAKLLGSVELADSKVFGCRKSGV